MFKAANPLERGRSQINWSQLLENLPLPNVSSTTNFEAFYSSSVKWICPTAPTRPLSLLGGFPCTAWFDAQDISENAPDDLEGLDASAAHVANLLSTEPADSIGGFSMGAATALYSATCHIFGQYANRNPYLLNLTSVIGLSGWLPCSRKLRNRIERTNETIRRAASLPILLCHGSGDDVVAYKHGENSARILSCAGFENLTFRSYNGLGHYTIPEEMDEVCRWLNARLGLQGS
ncbi:hypothetical protein DH2020_029141 [Rehmannia glutinosa]|uniref:Phospholipase/carboxylesterase/thioesterase domain-containing protein n=1 Tax=Rehmannia glutinosa TaxID=99300 RepID=A0ABR0VS63_REHGL